LLVFSSTLFMGIDAQVVAEPRNGCVTGARKLF
jgi:hypothetical protein